MNIDRVNISEAIKRKGIDGKCRECGRSTALDRDLAVVAQWPPEAAQPSVNKQMSVMAQLTCSNCGHVRMFNVGLLTA